MATTLSISFACAVLCCQVAAAHVAFKQIALTGDPAGTVEGAEFDWLYYPSVNSSGDVVFTAGLRAGIGGAPVIQDYNNPDRNASAIFGPTDGTGSPIGLIVRENDPAGTSDGAEFDSFSAPSLNASGDVAFRAELRTGPAGIPVISTPYAADSNFLAIYGPTAGPGSPLGLIARENTLAGVEDGATFGSFDRPIINDSGDVAFSADLRADSSGPRAVGAGFSIYGPTAGAGSPLGLIVRGEDDAGTGDGAEFFVLGGLNMNAHGDLTFTTILRGPTIDEQASGEKNELAIFGPTPDPNSVVGLVARENDSAGTDDGAEFDYFYNPVISNAGDLSFVASLRQGQGGAPVVTDYRDPDYNSIALFGPTTGAGSPRGLIVRGNDPTGFEDGAEFYGMANPSINSSGDIAFLAALRTGPDGLAVTEENDRALMVYTDSEFELIVREGEVFDVMVNENIEQRIVDTIVFFSRGLGDTRRLAFVLRFTDDTEGLFVADFAEVPEPSAAILGVLCIATIAVGRRT